MFLKPESSYFSIICRCPQVQYVKMEDLSQIAILNPHDYANMFQITRQDLIQWSYQIAEGMDYLTSKKVRISQIKNLQSLQNKLAGNSWRFGSQKCSPDS